MNRDNPPRPTFLNTDQYLSLADRLGVDMLSLNLERIYDIVDGFIQWDPDIFTDLNAVIIEGSTAEDLSRNKLKFLRNNPDFIISGDTEYTNQRDYIVLKRTR